MDENNHLYGFIVEDFWPLFWYPGDPLPTLDDYECTLSINNDLGNSVGYHQVHFIPLPSFKDDPGDYSQGWNDCINYLRSSYLLRKDVEVSTSYESSIEDI